MFVGWCVALIVGALYYLLVWKPRQYFEKNGVHYEKSWPIFGDMLPVVFQKLSLFENVQRVYENIGDRRFGGFFSFVTPVIMLKDPELIKEIAIKHFDCFMNHRTILTKEVDPIIGNVLLTLCDLEWKHVRSILTPAFTSKKMRAMLDLILICADQFSDHLTTAVLKDRRVASIEMGDLFTRFTNDVISSCAFGLETNSYRDPENEFYVTAREIANFAGLRGLKMFLATLSVTLMKVCRMSFLNGRQSAFYRSLVNDTMAYREQNNVTRPDLIHLLMQAKRGQFTDDENEAAHGELHHKRDLKFDMNDDLIVAQAVAFLIAGFETSATLMGFTAHELAVNLDVQEKLVQEVDDMLKQTDGRITFDKLMGLKYLDMVISESLRKWPPASLTDRRCVKDFILRDGGNGILIEKGIVLQIPIAALQRDGTYYPDPLHFDPERFNDDNKKNIHPGAYVPFGIGPRHCIGSRLVLLETKAVLVTLLSKFKIVPVEKTDIPLTLGKKSTTTLPEKDFWLGLEKRPEQSERGQEKDTIAQMPN